ncbi:hypothetical protein CBR_g89040, partial [Chara braunii]
EEEEEVEDEKQAKGPTKTRKIAFLYI